MNKCSASLPEEGGDSRPSLLRPRPSRIHLRLATVLIGVAALAACSAHAHPSGTPATLANHAASPSAAANQSAAPSAPATVTVPNLQGISEAVAVRQLTSLGLVEGKVQHREDPSQAGNVLSQSDALASVRPGSAVDLVIGVSLAAPAITSPVSGQGFGQGSSLDVRWSQGESWVTTWHVVTSKQNCYYYFAHSFNNCHWDSQADTTVGVSLYTAAFSLSYQPLLNLGNYNTGVVEASVAADDDFGTSGPATVVQFQIG